MRRIDRLVEGGIQLHLGFAVGEDATLDALRQKHDVILIATGVYKAREINVPGKAAEGVIDALDYLIASNRKSFGDDVPAFADCRLDAKDKLGTAQCRERVCQDVYIWVVARSLKKTNKL